MEAAGLWKAAVQPRLPTTLGKRFAFPTAPTALLLEKTGEENQKRRQSQFAELDVHNCHSTLRQGLGHSSGHRIAASNPAIRRPSHPASEAARSRRCRAISSSTDITSRSASFASIAT